MGDTCPEDVIQCVLCSLAQSFAFSNQIPKYCLLWNPWLSYSPQTWFQGILSKGRISLFHKFNYYYTKSLGEKKSFQGSVTEKFLLNLYHFYRAYLCLFCVIILDIDVLSPLLNYKHLESKIALYLFLCASNPLSHHRMTWGRQMCILDSGLRRPGPHGQGDLRNAPRASVFLIWEVKKQDCVSPQGFSLPKLSSSESARS